MISKKFFKEALDDLYNNYNKYDNMLRENFENFGLKLDDDEYCNLTGVMWGTMDSAVNTLLLLFYEDERLDREMVRYDDVSRCLIYDYFCGDISFKDMFKVLKEIKKQQLANKECPDTTDLEKIEKMIDEYKEKVQE